MGSSATDETRIAKACGARGRACLCARVRDLQPCAQWGVPLVEARRAVVVCDSTTTARPGSTPRGRLKGRTKGSEREVRARVCVSACACVCGPERGRARARVCGQAHAAANASQHSVYDVWANEPQSQAWGVWVGVCVGGGGGASSAFPRARPPARPPRVRPCVGTEIWLILPVAYACLKD